MFATRASLAPGAAARRRRARPASTLLCLIALQWACRAPGGAGTGGGLSAPEDAAATDDTGDGPGGRDTGGGGSDDDTGGDDTGGGDVDEPTFDPACPERDPDAEREPIYDHRVELLRSAEGLAFSATGFEPLDHASVADLFLLDAAPHMLFVDGQPGRHGLWLASAGAGAAPVVQDCVLIDGGWDRYRVDPDVVVTDAGLRLYWLEGVSPDDPPPDTRRVWTATSTDGRRFTDAEIALEAPDMTDPSVARGPDGRWWMAVSRVGRRTSLAVSEDGRSFVETGVAVETGDVPELHATPTGLRLYLTGERGIHSMHSEDGVTWTADAGARSSTGGSPSILEVDGAVWMAVVEGR